MPGFLLTETTQSKCVHGGTALNATTSGMRVKVKGQAVCTINDTMKIDMVPCTFTLPSGTPLPCKTMSGWMGAATRVKVSGAPALLISSAAMCLGGQPGPSLPPVATQTQVKGT